MTRSHGLRGSVGFDALRLLFGVRRLGSAMGFGPEPPLANARRRASRLAFPRGPWERVIPTGTVGTSYSHGDRGNELASPGPWERVKRLRRYALGVAVDRASYSTIISPFMTIQWPGNVQR